MQELLISVKEKTQKASIEEAKQEAEATTINTLTAQIMAQQAHDQKGIHMCHIADVYMVARNVHIM